MRMPRMDITALIERAAECGDPTSIGEELLAMTGAADATVDRYGSLDGGNPQKSQVFRIGISGHAMGLTHAIVKIPAKLRSDRVQEAVSGTYARDYGGYNLLRDMQGGFQPRIFAAHYDPVTKTSALLIEDLGDLPKRRQFEPKVLHDALFNLAQIHSRYWGDESLRTRWWMRDGYRADIFDEDVDQFAPNWAKLTASEVLRPSSTQTVDEVADFLAANMSEVLQELDDRPRTLTHGDLHTANMMLRRTDDGFKPVLIDWQDAVYSGASSDVAKFLSTTMSPEDARCHFDDLIVGYHAALRTDIRSYYSLTVFRRDVVLALLGTFANYVISATTSCSSDIDPKTLNHSLKRVSSVIDVLQPLREL